MASSRDGYGAQNVRSHMNTIVQISLPMGHSTSLTDTGCIIGLGYTWGVSLCHQEGTWPQGLPPRGAFENRVREGQDISSTPVLHAPEAIYRSM